MARDLLSYGHMPTELRLVWCSPATRAFVPPRSAEPEPPPELVAAQALVDDWMATPFESNATALADLVLRIAEFRRQKSLALQLASIPVEAFDPELEPFLS
jgi:hypothetical protein